MHIYNKTDSLVFGLLFICDALDSTSIGRIMCILEFRLLSLFLAYYQRKPEYPAKTTIAYNPKSLATFSHAQ